VICFSGDVVIEKIGQPFAFCGIWGWEIVIAWHLAKYSGLLDTILLLSFGATNVKWIIDCAVFVLSDIWTARFGFHGDSMCQSGRPNNAPQHPLTKISPGRSFFGNHGQSAAL
jgi:hypothetical protein